LIGDKVSYADLSFIPWQKGYESFLMPGWDFESELPEFAAWRQRLIERKSVQKVFAHDAFQYPKT